MRRAGFVNSVTDIAAEVVLGEGNSNKSKGNWVEQM